MGEFGVEVAEEARWCLRGEELRSFEVYGQGLLNGIPETRHSPRCPVGLPRVVNAYPSPQRRHSEAQAMGGLNALDPAVDTPAASG